MPMGNSSKSDRKGGSLNLSTFEVLTLLFVAGNFVITLIKLILELIKATKKNNRLNFGELTVIFLII
ncbi:putative holin-like toxin [uncultured Streptococcus sp.]|uniref:putative holin-like toxin n=2 Tax=uncultured Streptococcus sp. TaxID=83427 RepID=UPI00338EBAD9